MEHLPPLAEAGLYEPPQLLLRIKREAPWEYVANDDRGLNRWRRLEGRRGHGACHAYVGVVLDEDGQVAHGPRDSGNTLRDLALQHQNKAIRTWITAQHVVKHGRRDVVRQVSHDVVRRRDELSEGYIERIGLDQRKAADCDFGKARPKMANKPGVHFDCCDVRAAVEQGAGQDAETRPNLEYVPPRRRVSQFDDVLEHPTVDEVVLTTLLACAKPVAVQVTLDTLG